MDGIVGIIGYGRIGRALERLAATAHRRVLTWNTAPDSAVNAPSLEVVARAVDLLFLCVPSWSVRAVAARAAGVLSSSTVVVSFAKGIEAETGCVMDEVLDAVIGERAVWGIAGGPMLAEELVRNQPGFLVLGLPVRQAGLPAGQAGASGRAVAPRVRNLFEGSNVHVSVTTDAHGVALGGVLKNVYATLIGAAHGLGMGSNAIGVLTLAAQDELLEVGTACGARRATLAGLAGIGDLLTTVSSAESRNRHAGECIARGELPGEPGEGCSSLVPFIGRLTREGIGMPPLLAALADIVLHSARPLPVLEALIRRLPFS